MKTQEWFAQADYDIETAEYIGDILDRTRDEIFEPIEAIAMTPEEWKRKDSPIVNYASKGEVLG